MQFDSHSDDCSDCRTAYKDKFKKYVYLNIYLYLKLTNVKHKAEAYISMSLES